MTRAATSPEVAKFASDGQWSEVFAYVANPAVVFAARVNQATVKYDKLARLTFDTVTTGAYTDILPGMTVMVGSASGGHDKGIGYARKAATSTLLYLGETSEITAADNDYITVLREFGVWAKRPSINPTTGAIYINYDEAYSAQLGTRKSIIIMGGDRVLELTGATVATTYALSGCASYVTTCAGATVTDGTTDHPTITANATGEYLVKVVGTASNSTVTTTYRYVYVVPAAPTPNVIVTDNTGDAAGWSARLQLYEDTSAIRDRAKVIIYARDYYGGTLGSIGSLAGCENIITTGWIVGQSIDIDPDGGGVTFDIRPASYWLDNVPSNIEVRLNQVSGTPANWRQINSLTMDKMLWHLAENYTTLLNSMDLILTGDTRTALSLTAPIASVWQQMNGLLDNKMRGNLYCNQYGQLIARIDTPLIPIAERTGIPVVVTLTADDFQGVTVETLQLQPNAQLIVTGQLPNGTIVAGIGGGHDPDRFGQTTTIDGLMVATQAAMNVLAGSLFARDNCPYKFSITNLRGNNRLIEPGDRVGLTLTGTDNLAGLAYNDNVIVRSISRQHNPDTGGWQIDVEADAETQAGRYVTGEVPSNDDLPFTPPPWVSFPPISPFPPGPPPPLLPPPPPPPPPDPSSCLDDSPPTGPYYLMWDRAFIDGEATYSTRHTYAWKSCSIRGTGAINPTALHFVFNNVGLAYTHLHLYAVGPAANRIATGTITIVGAANPLEAFVTFTEVSALTVAGFELELDEGKDSTGDGNPIIYDSTIYGEINDSGGTTSHAYDVVNLQPDTIRFGFSTTLTESSGLFGCEFQFQVKANCTTHGTALNYECYLYVAAGAASAFSLSDVYGWSAGHPGFDFTLGPVVLSGTFGDTGTDDLFHRILRVRSGDGTGLFATFGDVYITSGSLVARSATLAPAMLLNVCPAV